MDSTLLTKSSIILEVNTLCGIISLMIEADLSVKDPRGADVFCSGFDLQWYLHGKHPENDGVITRQHVELTVSQPDDLQIFVDEKRPHRCYYYRHFSKKGPAVKVVVDFRDETKGTIKTIYPCSNQPKGERVLWSPRLAEKRK